MSDVKIRSLAHVKHNKLIKTINSSIKRFEQFAQEKNFLSNKLIQFSIHSFYR